MGASLAALHVRVLGRLYTALYRGGDFRKPGAPSAACLFATKDRRGTMLQDAAAELERRAADDAGSPQRRDSLSHAARSPTPHTSRLRTLGTPAQPWPLPAPRWADRREGATGLLTAAKGSIHGGAPQRQLCVLRSLYGQTLREQPPPAPLHTPRRRRKVAPHHLC